MAERIKFKRHVYLNLKTLEEAQGIFLGRFASKRFSRESIPTADALNRVTAEPVFARLSSPAFHSAAMDGIAVRAERTYGASPDRPMVLSVGNEAFYVNTGHVLPEGTNAVIMIEHVNELDLSKVQIEAAAYPWQHVRKVGEDIVATQMLLPQGCRLGPYELGALAASGSVEVPVKKRPAVAIIPSGSELIPHDRLPDTGPRTGQVVEFNSVILKSLTLQAGAEPTVFDIVPDDYETILAVLRRAVASEADLIIINAGSSAGSEDYTATAIAELGEVLVHGGDDHARQTHHSGGN